MSETTMKHTHLAKKLIAIREKAIKNGMTLLSEDEILKDIENRRTGSHE